VLIPTTVLIPTAARASPSRHAVGKASQTPPTGTLEVSFAELVTAGKTFAISTNFNATATGVAIYVDLKPLPSTGAVCASSHALEPPGAQLVVGGDHKLHDKTPASLARPGVYVACAWLEWRHGTIDGPFSTRFVVAARGQRAATYFGSTSQLLTGRQTSGAAAISLQTIDGEVVNLVYWARYTCTKPGATTTHPIYATSFPAFAVGPAGLLTGRYAQGTDAAMIEGAVTDSRAGGTFSETYTGSGYTCRSGTVSFDIARS
jgi:hypothetical protein